MGVKSRDNWGGWMKKIVLSVIGLGKLGKPIYEVLKTRFEVIGIDKNQKNCSYERLGDISFVIVPTPSNKDGSFTSEYVEEVLKQIKKKHIVVIVSTLSPGETDRMQEKYKHLKLIYNPTFVALGSVKTDFLHPDFILIGSKHRNSVNFLEQIYSKLYERYIHIAHLTPLEAEIAKLSLNCYVTIKITFANQIGNLCYRVGADAGKVLSAIGNDKRINQHYFSSGLGYGGPCFPRDNRALSHYFMSKDLVPFLFEIVHGLNENQAEEIEKRVMALSPEVVGFEGLSYKQGSDVTECSQLSTIYNSLKNKGYKVVIGKGDVNLNWSGICEQ